MYSYRSNAASPQNDTSVQNTRKVCTFTTAKVSVQTEAVLLLTLMNMAPYAKCTHHSIAGVMAASIVWIFSWSAVMLCNWLQHHKFQVTPQEGFQWCEVWRRCWPFHRSPWTNPLPRQKTYLTTGTQYIQRSDAPACWK